MISIIQYIFNILDKCFLKLYVHFLISDSHVIFIIWFFHTEQWLSSQTSCLFFGSFEELSKFTFLQSGHFCRLQISSVSCQSENFCFCIICLLILSLHPRSFIQRQTQFILECLFKKTFHILAKKQDFAKWNSCVEFFQNHVFQPEVKPKNDLGSHISCHTFQSCWQAAKNTVCRNFHFHFNQSTGLQGRSLYAHSHLEMAPRLCQFSDWMQVSAALKKFDKEKHLLLFPLRQIFCVSFMKC